MTLYRIFITDAGGFRNSSLYEYVADFGDQKLATNYVRYMGSKKRYSGKDIIIKAVDLDTIDSKAGRVDGVITALGEALSIDEIEFS